MTFKEGLLLAAGFLTSLVASVSLWWFVTKRLVPRLRFAAVICWLPHTDGLVTYRVKLRNESRFRGVLDLQVSGTLTIHLPIADETGNRRALLRIPVSNVDIKRVVPRGQRVLTLDLQGMSAFAYKRLPSEVSQRFKASAPGALESALEFEPNAHVRLEVLGYDDVSGARKYFESPHYCAPDCVRGRFVPGYSLEVDEQSSEPRNYESGQDGNDVSSRDG